MWRRLWVALGAVVLVLLGALGWAVVSANRLAEHYQPDIERAAGSALGAPVRLGALHVSLFPAAHVAIDQVAVGDGGLSLRNVGLRLRLLPLLHGALDISTLSLDAPHLTLVRDANGVSLEGVPRPMPKRGTASTSAKPSGGTTMPPLLALDLRRFEIRHGSVDIRDTIHKTTLTLTDLSVDAALVVDAAGIRLPQLHGRGTLADTGQVTIEGKDLGYDLAKGVVQVPALTVELPGGRVTAEGRFDTTTGEGSAAFHAERLDLAKGAPLLGLVAPDVVRLGLHGSMAPDLKVQTGPGEARLASGTVQLADVEFAAGAAAVRKLHGRLDLTGAPAGATVASRDLALELNGTPVAITLSTTVAGDTAALKEVVVTAFGGTTRLNGTYGIANRQFTADVDATGLDLAALEKAGDPRTPPRMTGTVVDFQSKVAGTSGEHIERSLSGAGAAQLKDARLLGVNVVADVMKKLGTLPFASAIRLPPDLTRAVQSPDTEITSLTADFTIGGAALHVQRAAVLSPTFSFDGAGRSGFDGSLDFQGTLRLSPTVSREIVGSVKELGLALDGQGRIAIPLTMQGTPPKVTVVPDVTRLFGSSLNKAAGGLLKGLGDLLKRR